MLLWYEILLNHSDHIVQANLISKPSFNICAVYPFCSSRESGLIQWVNLLLLAILTQQGEMILIQGVSNIRRVKNEVHKQLKIDNTAFLYAPKSSGSDWNCYKLLNKEKQLGESWQKC